MNNIKPISSFGIFKARVIGLFPFFTNILILAVVGLTIWFLGISYWYVLLVPFAVVALYYFLYFSFVLLCKTILFFFKTNKH